MSIMSVLSKGSPVRVAEGALHKQPQLVGRDGFVAKLPGKCHNYLPSSAEMIFLKDLPVNNFQ